MAAVECGPSRWVLWLWAGAMIVVGAFYAVAGDGGLPILAPYRFLATYAPLILFWALTGVGETSDAAVNRRRGWGARLASSLVTAALFTGPGLIVLWILAPLNGTNEVVDPFLGLVIVPFGVVMVLAPVPAALVNGHQAAACEDRRRALMLAAVAAIHWFPLLGTFIEVAVPDGKAITARVVAGGAVAIGLALVRLLRAEGAGARATDTDGSLRLG